VKLSPHFDDREFRSKDGAKTPASARRLIKRLCEEVLERLRAELGGVPITIVSGYRSPEYNAKVKGAKASRHMMGDAADIRAGGVSLVRIYRILDRWQRDGTIPRGGLGYYRSNKRRVGFVHVDIRGKLKRWGAIP